MTFFVKGGVHQFMTFNDIDGRGIHHFMIFYEQLGWGAPKFMTFYDKGGFPHTPNFV